MKIIKAVVMDKGFIMNELSNMQLISEANLVLTQIVILHVQDDLMIFKLKVRYIKRKICI